VPSRARRTQAAKENLVPVGLAPPYPAESDIVIYVLEDVHEIPHPRPPPAPRAGR
jgi:hypothetical protein